MTIEDDTEPLVHRLDSLLPLFDVRDRPMHDGLSDIGERWVIEPSKLYLGPYLQAVADMPCYLTLAAEHTLKGRFGDNRLPHQILPKIDFAITQDCGINCFADLFDGKFTAAMEGLLPLAALEISIHFFSRKDYKPTIGSVDKTAYLYLSGTEEVPFFQLVENRFIPLLGETVPKTSLEGLYRSAVALRGNARKFDVESGMPLQAEAYVAQFDTLIEYMMPRCEVRQKYVYYAALSLCLFFWLHESSHVVDGHLDRLQAAQDSGASRISEHVNYEMFEDKWAEQSYCLPKDQLLAMELQADSEAITLVTALILEGYDDDLFGAGLENNFPETSKEERVEIFLLAVYSALNAMRCKELYFSAITGNNTHPRFSIRSRHVLAIVFRMAEADPRLENCIQNLLDEIESLKNDVSNAWLLSEKGKQVFDLDLDLEEIVKLGRLGASSLNDEHTKKYGSVQILVQDTVKKLIEEGVAERI
jgi:hypothetical protein